MTENFTSKRYAVLKDDVGYELRDFWQNKTVGLYGNKKDATEECRRLNEMNG